MQVPLALGDLIDRMLDLDPADRPSAEEAEAILAGCRRGHNAVELRAQGAARCLGEDLPEAAA